MGSFFNVLIHRLPRKESIIYPASHCSECKARIPFWHNLPIISYLILGGKCSSCKAKIHWHHLLVEVVTPILFLALYLKYGMFDFMLYKYLILLSFLIPIFFIDLFHQLILHVTSIPLIIIGLIISAIPYSDITLINALGSGAFILLMMMTIAWLYSKTKKIDGLGGGDIWLMTAIAVYFGALSTPFIMLISSVFGLLYFAIFIRSKDKGFAFGPHLVIGTLVWIFVGEELLNYIL